MILKELNLVSFGKFQNKRINLKEGLNILYGENESGKTTIHNFIDGMFYGFLRPYAKKRYYLEEHEKYRPWNSSGYMGILKFKKNGKVYRIERNFDKGEVKVYDELTGKDITDKIDSGEKVKVHLPGLYFFDFNTTVYKNTVSIKQLGNKIDSALAMELKDRLANISTSLDDEISVKKAISYLEKELDKIGTDKAYTKPYGKSLVKLNELKGKRKLALEKQKQYHKYIEEINVLRDKIEHEESKINQLKVQLEKAELREKKKKYEEILTLKKEINLVDKKIQKLEPYSNLKFDDYTKSLRLENNKESLDKEINELRLKIYSLEYRLKEKDIENKEQADNGIKVEELFNDINNYNEIEDEKNNLIFNNQQNRLENLSIESKKIEDRINKSRIARNIFSLLSVVSFGLVVINSIYIIFPLFFMALFFITKTATKRFSQELKDLNNKAEKITSKENEIKKRLKSIEECQKEIMFKYSCSTKLELNRLYQDIQLNQINKNQRIEIIKQLKIELKESKSILEMKEEEKRNAANELTEILYKNNSRNLEEFKEGLNKKQYYKDLHMKRKGKVEIINRVLGNITLEELKEQLYIIEENEANNIEQLSISTIKDEIKSKEEHISMIRNTYYRLEERVNNLSKEVEHLINIEEEIIKIKDRIKYFKNKIKSIKIAKSTIEDISQEIHSQFAPRINKDVSKLIYHITGGKYEEIKINEDLDITIENPSTKEIINIDSLSSGTIDQLYFSLRFSIISSMKEDNLPLILDDCFVQYDRKRLRSILTLLDNISNKRQILLFTCHQRENEILDRLELKYNIVNLS